MPEPDQTLPVLHTVSDKLARNSDVERFKATQLDPEKRKTIEDLLRKGMGIVKTAHEVGSSPSTVMRIRDDLVEREPEFFRAHIAGSIQRVANKAIGTIERGLDAMEQADVKPGQLAGLSVALGILLDKQAALTGNQQVTVVEHRLKVDADTVRSLVQSQSHSQRNQVVEAEVIDVTPEATEG